MKEYTTTIQNLSIENATVSVSGDEILIRARKPRYFDDILADNRKADLFKERIYASCKKHHGRIRSNPWHGKYSPMWDSKNIIATQTSCLTEFTFEYKHDCERFIREVEQELHHYYGTYTDF